MWEKGGKMREKTNGREIARSSKQYDKQANATLAVYSKRATGYYEAATAPLSHTRCSAAVKVVR
jgi:hypothetical protein